MKKNVCSSLRLILSLSTFFFCHSVLAVVVGSETAVSVEASTTFPAADADNMMLGFGWFKSGFILEDQTTTCSFNSVYPISGSVDLNGGTLYLSQDLFFNNKVNLLGLGTIVGNGNVLVDFCSSITYLPDDTECFDNVTLFFDNDLTLNTTVHFKNNCLIDGKGNTLVLGDQAALIIDQEAELKLRNIEIEGVSGYKIRCEDDTARLILDEVKWVQDGNYTFSMGSITYVDEVNLFGKYGFSYESNRTSTVKANSTLHIVDGINFEVGITDATERANPLYFEDQTAIIRIDNSNLTVRNSGANFTRGTLMFDSEIVIDIDSTTTENGVITGNGVADDDMILQFNAGSTVKLNSGHSTFKNVSPDFMKASAHKSARLIRMLGSHFFVDQDITFPSMAIETNSNDVEPTQVAAGKTLAYNNALIVLPTVEFDVTGQLYGGTSFMLTGGGQVFLTRGSYPMGLIIIGPGNLLQGSGSIIGPIIINDSTAQLICMLHGSIDSSVTLNGGTLTLSNDLSFGSAGVLYGDGLIDLSTFTLNFSAKDVAWTGNRIIQGENATIALNSDLSFSKTMTIQGSLTIDGNGHSIKMEDGGAIVVDEGSSLELRHLCIENLADNNIRCIDNDAQIILNDVSCIQNADYTFTVGSFSFVNNVSFVGSSTFGYASVRTSTIAKNSCLLIAQDMHFCVGRNQVDAEPLYFEDNTSVLSVDNGTLVISENGMMLTRGVIDFYNAVNLDIKSTNTQTGLIWGNGNAADDIKIRFNSGALLNHLSGHLVYNNNGGKNIESTSLEARFVRNTGSHFYIAKTIDMPSFTIEVAANGVEKIQFADGATLTNNNTRAEGPFGVLQVKTERYSPTEVLLDSGGSISIDRGGIPTWIVIDGTGSSIQGSGNIVRPVRFLSSSAETTISLLGEVFGDITLNNALLNLGSSLNLGPGVVIVGPGIVDLTTCGLLTGRQNTLWDTDIKWQGVGGFVELNSNADLNSTWTFSGNCSIDGQSNTLTLGDSAEIIISADSTLAIKNMTLKDIEGTKIRCLSDTSKVLLDDVTFLLSNDMTFSTGSIEILDTVDFSGSYTFSYESAQTSTIALKSRWNFSDGATFKVGKLSLDDVEPISFEGSSSTLGLENCTLCIANSGTIITKGKISCARDVIVDILGTSTSEGLIFGDGTIDGNMVLELNAGATISIVNGFFVYDVVDPNGIESSSQTVRFLRSDKSNIYVKQDLFLSNITVEAGPLAVLNVADGKTLGYDKFVALQEDGEFEITGNRINWFMSALTGNNSIFLNKGLLASYLAISGTNNVLQGNGNLTGQIILQDSSSSFDYSINGFVNNHIILAGGTVSLSGNMNLGSGVLINGPGVVNLGGYKLSTGSKDTYWATDIYWQGENSEIEIGSNLSLSGTWTLSDSCTIDGNGNDLDLSAGGNIEIIDGSKVQFKNIVLTGLNGKNLRCLDNSSSIEFNNAELIQSEDFIFDTGSISFENSVSIMGSYTFVYDSSQTSTIQLDSSLFIAEGVHFCIGRYDTLNSIEPLYFVDSSSSLNFDQSSLIITSSGLQLTRGTVTFDRDVLFDVLSTTTEYGLIWGDGNSDNDVIIRFDPGAAVVHKRGYFVYNNGSPYRIHAPSESASYRRLEGSRTYIAQDVVFPSFRLEAQSMTLSPIEIASGVSLEFDGSHIVMPVGSHTLKSIQQEAGVYKMNGSADTLTLNQGIMPFSVEVVDGNNSLSGTGRVSGLVSLQGKDSELTIDLNGDILQSIQLVAGKVILNRDIKFDSGVILQGPGAVDLGVYTLELSQKETTWDEPIEWSGDGGVLSINGVLNLSSTWTMQESCVIQGNGNTINFGDDGSLVIDSDATLLFKNVRLKGLKGNNIKCLTDTGRLILDDVVWLQDGDFTFTMGSISFVDDVDFAGEYTFFYQSSQTSTVDVKSSWNITNRMTLDIGKVGIDENEPLAFVDSSSVLGLNNCTLCVNEHGMRGTKGNITAERDVAVEIASTSTQSGLIFGDGTSDNDMIFELYPGTTVRIERGALTYDVTLQDGIRSRSKTAKILRTDDSVLYVAQNLELANITVEAGAAATLNVADEKTLSYNPIVALDANGEFEVTGSRVNWFMNMLSGDQSVFVNKGVLPTYLLIAGINNVLHGNGIVTGGINFNDSSAQMLYRLNGVVSNNIALNGGTLTLERDLEFTKGFSIVGPGSVTMNSNQITLGTGEFSSVTPLTFIGDDSTLNLRGKVNLASDWEIQGSCRINGNGNILQLESSGQIIVTEGATLELKDVDLRGIQGNNIYCLDNDSSIVLNNVVWQQDDTYTFSIGSIAVKNQTVLGGKSKVFVYQSIRTSTIKANSNLKIDESFTFSYDPIGSASKDLLELEDSSSDLVLKNAFLHASDVGLHLTKGRLNIKGDCCLSAHTTQTVEGIIYSEGITIGDGSEANDCSVEIFTGAALNVAEGSLIYKNVALSSWVMLNAWSTLYMHEDTTLSLEETLNLGPGRLLLHDDTVLLDITENKEITGSVFVVNG